MKKFLVGVGLTLVLASCGGPQTPVSRTVNNVSGTVVEVSTSDNGLNMIPKAWTGGAGTVIVRTSEDAELSRSTLKADGTFTVNLPTPTSGLKPMDVADLQDLTPTDTDGLTCTGTPTASGSGVQGTGAHLTVDAAKDGAIAPMTITGSQSTTTKSQSIKWGGLVYVNGPMTIKGTRTCTGSGNGNNATLGATFNVELQAGWNLLTLEMSETLQKTGDTTGNWTATASITSGSLPTNQWVFTGDSALSLASSAPALR